MDANYFFIDGSALTSQVRQLWREDTSLVGRKLCPILFLQHFMLHCPDLHNRNYKRMTLYFPLGDEESIGDFLLMPDAREPGRIRDIHFKYCGYKMKWHAEFNEFVETKVPPKFRDRFQKSEKGIDVEICCDALKLASAGRLDRLFLMTNDDDFLPLCRTLKEFGANVSIIHLSDTATRNLSLLKETDSFDVVSRDRIQMMFLPLPEASAELVALPEGTSAMKPESPPAAIPDPEKASESLPGELATPENKKTGGKKKKNSQS